MADRQARVLRGVGTGLAVALLASCGYLAVSRATDAGPVDLVTARVGRGDVTQTTTLVGTVRRVDEESLSFPTAGRVTSVKVAVGDRVTKGQVLATMDPSDLSRSVSVAEANLVAAQAALTAAQSATTTATTTAATTVPSATTTSGTTKSGTATSGSGTGKAGGTTRTSGAGRTGGSATVDTKPLDRATTDLQRLVSASSAACAPLLGTTVTQPKPRTRPSGPSTTPTTPLPTGTTSLPTTPDPTTTTSAAPVTTGTGTTTSTDSATVPDPTGTTATTTTSTPTTSPTTPTPDPREAQLAACVTALGRVLASQQGADRAAQQLARQIAAAAVALQQQTATGTPTGKSGTGGTGATTGAGGQNGTGGAAKAGGTGGTGGSGGSGALGAANGGSPADAEVTVLKSEQALATAQQALAAATLRASVSGVVGSVGLVAGQLASPSDSIVLVGTGTANLTVEVPLSQLGMLRVAQAVRVTPAGTTTAYDGTIQSIGVLPGSTTSTTPTYPVVVAVDRAPTVLATNAQASARIELATASHVLTVPVSAVDGVSDGIASVSVVSGGTTTPTRITVGAVGGGLAQVESGLTEGQLVLLADPSTPLPTATIGGGRFGGGFGGGAGPVGGGFNQRRGG